VTDSPDTSILNVAPALVQRFHYTEYSLVNFSYATGVVAVSERPTQTATKLADEDARQSLERLGDRLRRLSFEHGLTLDDLAARSAVSPSFLSQLERGICNPSFITLTSIATALGVDPSVFFSIGQVTDGRVVRAGKRRHLVIPELGVIYEMLTREAMRDFEAVLVEYEPTSVDAAPYQHK
jgi:transcriptional regulator with XRE-family HTH domain